MKTPCIIILFLLIAFNSSNGQTIYFNNIYNYNYELQFGFDVFPLGDTAYVTLTGSLNLNTNNQKILVDFFDSTGKFKSQKMYGDSGFQYFPGEWGSMQRTFDGGYVFGGSISSNSDNSSLALLIKLNAKGDTGFIKTFGDTSIYWQVFYRCVQTYDSGYALVGIRQLKTTLNNDIYLVRTDKNGNELWEKTFGGDEEDDGHSIFQLSNHHLVLSGWQTYTGNGYYPWIIETNSAGNIVKQKLFNSGADTCGGYVIATAYNHQYILGGCQDTIVNTTDAPKPTYFALLDSSFNVKWKVLYNKQFGDGPYEEKQLSDSSFILIGYVELFGTTGWIAKTDKNGNKLWEHYYHYSLYQTFNYFADIQQTNDKGFIITGASFDTSISPVTQSLWLVKLDSNGNLGSINTGITEIKPDSEGLTIFPNPTNDEINIAMLEGGILEEVSIADITGRVWKQFEPLQSKAQLSITELPQGIYFVQIKTDKGIEVRKVVKSIEN